MLTNCKILIAKSAGFCFGVDRAVKMVYNNLYCHDNVVTYGQIIHNNAVVADLKEKGVRITENINDINENDVVIIRSHGVPKIVCEQLNTICSVVIDATCPYVSRIQKIAYEKSSSGYTIFIAGDKNHPEVEGIKGYCVNECSIFSDVSELKTLLKNEDYSEKKVAFLAQTTYNKLLWEECKNYINSVFPESLIYDTICSATELRQQEAAKIASQSDIMIIVGARHSSNTKKLYEICSELTTCFLIENADELSGIDFKNARNIGISAGASTPAYIIKEVQTTMSEIIKNLDEDFNFEEAFEQSFKKIYTGDKVKGYITAVNNTEVIVDIGTKHTGYIPLSELSEDPTVRPSDVCKPGDEMDLIVVKMNDQEGIVTLSKKRVDALAGFEKIVEASTTGGILTGVVVNVVKGGILVASNGVKVFIPASQATMRRDEKLEALLKKTISFKILEVNEVKSRAVGSIKAVAKELNAAKEDAFFASTNVGDVLTGTVKSITDYGVFVDLGAVDGLIRKPDLTWIKIKHPSDIVRIGEKIEVTVKDIDEMARKISLVYRKESENPWEIFRDKYHAGDVINVKIVSLTDFGAFAQIIPGIDGLIHISQIANQRVDKISDLLKVGQTVDVKITEIDSDSKRISLSMRALIEDEEVVSEEETAE